MKPFRVAAVALALALAGALAAGAAEIVVWHAYREEEKEAFEKVVAQYNALPAARGNRVTTLAVPYDAFADKITAAVPRGKGPDIFIYAQDRLGGWIEAGNTVDPIDFFLDKATRDRFIEKPLFDQASRLRAAVETNRSEGAQRVEEIGSWGSENGSWP